MTNYSAEKSEAVGHKTIGQASVGVGRVLWELQGLNTNHAPRKDKVISRTSSRKHYRVPPRLVELLSLETTHPLGLEPTEPPTVLVRVDAMVAGLETYAGDAGYHKMGQRLCRLLQDEEGDSLIELIEPNS